MNIELKEITIRELSNDFEDNAENGVVGYDGKLDIRPPYQREFIYKDKQRDAVINTITKNFPLNVMYWAVREDGTFEVIDGQQRTISICQYVNGDFAYQNRYFHNLKNDEKEQILNYKLMVYVCSGTESEKLEWFETINISGVPLTNQELLNAVYSGPFVTLGKEEFSNSQNANIQKWSAYVSGSANRQDFLERALEWVSKENVGDYMSKHRFDNNITELKNYFTSVIDWVSTVFTDVESEMKGLEWGRLYETYKKQPYNSKTVSEQVKKLYADPYIKNRKGVFEFILGGSTDFKLLEVRVFDEATKKSTYAIQTAEAEKKNISNCSHCAIGHDANKTKIWKLAEMDADHVTAWSKGGATDTKNCEMLCKSHNRAKGNK